MAGLDGGLGSDSVVADMDETTKLEIKSSPAPVEPPIRAPTELLSVGLLDFLELDDRPILIFDLTSATKTIPVYSNPSLRELEKALGNGGGDFDAKAVEDSLKEYKDAGFAAWAVSAPIKGSPVATFGGMEWTRQTLRAQWRLVAGQTISQYQALVDSGTSSPDVATNVTANIRKAVEQSKSLQYPSVIFPLAKYGPEFTKGIRQNSLERQLEAFRLHNGDAMSIFPDIPANETKSQSRNPIASSSMGRFDFLGPNPSVELSAYIRFFLFFDWSSTELGPITSWSIDLRRMVNLMLTDPRAVSMYWGESKVMIYNEAYVELTGQRHPGMLGKPYREAWKEIAEDFEPVFNRAYDTGTATMMNETLFYIEREGYLEETYFSFSIIPFGTSDGIAFYNPVFDTTRQVISDRRMSFLLRLGQKIASSREPKDFWSQLLRGLEPHPAEVPFALLYSAGGDINETLSVSCEQCQGLDNWVLEGTVRTREDCASIPRQLRSTEALEEFIPNFLDVVRSEPFTLLQVKDGTLSPALVQAQGVQDSCHAAIFLPIRSTGDNVLGFLIVGISPRKRYDDDYQLFIEMISRQLTTSLAAALLFEDETQRANIAAQLAAEERKLLSKKLAIQTQEAQELESRFRRMADMAPVGMFQISPTGELMYANEAWFDLTKYGRDLKTIPMGWLNVLIDEDLPLMKEQWVLVTTGQSVTFEIRLKKSYDPDETVSGEKVHGYTWIIASAYPKRARDGTILSILGCLTDISRQKWAEGFRERKMIEAIELKRQQENFIDMTSHEMRNPLSAIIQCADFISTSVCEFRGEALNITIPEEVSESYIDAAQTIILCAQHQKRIIDDILMLSKVDSDLLVITPVESQPVAIIKNAMRMFGRELQKSDIELRFQVDLSFSELTIDWVKIDPSRMLQVLINLLTNAIKFTQLEVKRRIIISIGATLERPSTNHLVEYLPRSSNRKDMSLGPAWGTGETVYLRVEVQDSGRGLTEHERKLLFQRFSQASPRTHVQYGGSGLGLFISRELTELQGGQIGVASKAGVGSTFTFYVKARRCESPETPEITLPIVGDLRLHTKTTSETNLSLRKRGSIASTRSPEPRSQSPLLGPKHILVVEDNLVNQKVLSKQLHAAGCVVSVANHGGEALEYLKTSRYWKGQERTGKELSIVLMDLEMPIMDGLTCVKEIRKLQDEGLIMGHVPVIAVTANARSEQIAMAKEAGMDSVVTKPFRIPELMPEMDRQMRRQMALAAVQGGRPSMEGERSNSAPG